MVIDTAVRRLRPVDAASAELADRLFDEGLLVPFATYGIASYFSEEIGCHVASASCPGINLVALCREAGS